MLEPGTAAVFISQLESHFALDSCHWKHPKAEKSLKRSSCSSLALSLGSLWSSWMDEIGVRDGLVFPPDLIRFACGEGFMS